MIASKIIPFFCLLALLSIMNPAHAFTFKLNKGGLFCYYKTLQVGQQYTGTYVVSGYDENSVDVRVRHTLKKESIYQNDKHKEGTWDFVATEDGDYKTCFKNNAKKDTLISLDIFGAEEAQASASSSETITASTISGVVQSLKTAVSRVKKVRTNLGFQKTRSNMHEKNMSMLANKLQWSVIFKVAVLMTVAAAQIYILTKSLTKQRKNMV